MPFAAGSIQTCHPTDAYVGNTDSMLTSALQVGCSNIPNETNS